MSALTLDRPWLEFDLGEEMQVLSWALNRPGFVTASRILWREVRNGDLPPDLDVGSWLTNELQARDATDAVTLLTSRDVRQVREHSVTIGTTTAHAVATTGLSNAESVGHRVDRKGKDWGTINVALRISTPLTQAALIEVMSIAVQARTAAVIEVDHTLPTGRATGTGTDCVAVAAPVGTTQFAGLHTEIGEAAGRAVYTTVLEGARDWMATVRHNEGAA
ncbi:adenosylcobinamide amidohydrolase [Roseovarius sp. 2305UL8-3]|uniref:adenosylcobinamide amidohydrolase n=1 Tax=Roseovarius conchicola TaxID=3121636 RepID=UPI0035288AA4